MGERIEFGDGELTAEVVSRGEYGLRRIRLTAKGDVTQTIERLGHVPLPPYISRQDEPADRERYQTIFADHPGAVAAPTAGLHFSPAILDRLRQRGIEMAAITLDVGLGTFQPIHEEEIERHQIHSERYEIPEAAAAAICKARRDGRPILAVGTTVVRALEDAAAEIRRAARRKFGTRRHILVEPGSAEARIFIKPGHTFRVVESTADEFPSAAIHAADSGQRVRGARIHPARLPARRRRAVPLLQLRRLHVDQVDFRLVGEVLHTLESIGGIPDL